MISIDAGQNLENAIKNAGMSKAGFGRIMQEIPQTVNGWVKRRGVPANKVHAAAAVLKVPATTISNIKKCSEALYEPYDFQEARSSIPIVGDNLKGPHGNWLAQGMRLDYGEWHCDFTPPMAGSFALRVIDNSLDPVVKLGQAIVIWPADQSDHKFIRVETGECHIGATEQIGPLTRITAINNSANIIEISTATIELSENIAFFAMQHSVKHKGDN